MKILAFSDWRVQTAKMLNITIEEHQPDVILYAGDDLLRVIPVESKIYLKTPHHFVELSLDSIEGKPIFNSNERNKPIFNFLIEKAEKKLLALAKSEVKYGNIPFHYVNGNDDEIIIKNGNAYCRVRGLSIGYENEYYKIVETAKRKISIHKIRGISSIKDKRYGLFFRFTKPPAFGLQKIGHDISVYGVRCSYGMEATIKSKDFPKADIYLSHLPPKGCLDLSIRFGVKHIGSALLRNKVQKMQPQYVVCGHSHFWGGKKDKIGESVIINVSSHDSEGAPGNYVLIDVNAKSVEIKRADYKILRQIRGAHFPDILERRDVYSVNGKNYNEVLYSYNLLDNENARIIEQLEKHSKYLVADRVRSLEWKKPRIISNLSFDPRKYALIDVETGIFKGKNSKGRGGTTLWLVGILFKRHIYQFEMPSQQRELELFMYENGILKLVSWTGYDSQLLRNRRGFKSIKWIDAAKRAGRCVIWHSYKLDDLFKALIKPTDEDEVDGAMAGVYAEHMIVGKAKCSFCPPKAEIINSIKLKNNRDLTKMFELCEFLRNFDLTPS